MCSRLQDGNVRFASGCWWARVQWQSGRACWKISPRIRLPSLACFAKQSCQNQFVAISLNMLANGRPSDTTDKDKFITAFSFLCKQRGSSLPKHSRKPTCMKHFPFYCQKWSFRKKKTLSLSPLPPLLSSFHVNPSLQRPGTCTADPL